MTYVSLVVVAVVVVVFTIVVIDHIHVSYINPALEVTFASPASWQLSLISISKARKMPYCRISLQHVL